MIRYRMLQRPMWHRECKYPFTEQWLRKSVYTPFEAVRHPILGKKIGLYSVIRAEIIQLWFEDIPVLLSADVELPANEFLFPIQDTYTIRRKE